MPNIIGVDLGVRTAHISTSRYCFSIGLKPKQGDRWEEIQTIKYCLENEIDTELGPDVYAYVEEPLVAGVRNLRTSLRIAQIAGAVLSVVKGEFVPVSAWKKATVGKGNAKKEEVFQWATARKIYTKPFASQDHADATCLRLYGLGQHV